MTEDKMVGWHHQLDGHEFEQALGDGEGQGRLVGLHGVTKSWTRLSDYNNNSLMSMCQAFICKQWSMIVDLLAKK